MARKKLPPNVDLCIGLRGYPYGRCIAISKGRRNRNPDLDYDGLRCRYAAIKGYRVCYLHGANMENKGGRPPIHGRRSAFAGDPTRGGRGLEPLIQKFLGDPNWADLRQEIAILRALLEVYLEKHENDHHDEDAQKHVAKMTDQIGILVDRLHKILYGEEYTINVYGIQAFAARVAEVINAYVTDKDTLLNIYNGLSEIFSAPVEPRAQGRLQLLAESVDA